NNILVGIMGNLSLARRELIGFSGRESENIIEILTEAERASVQARNLTHQLLNFSMGDSPVKKTGSIASLLKESASFVLRGSKVHAEFVLDKEIQEVEMDEGQINQVIHNVLINSMEAMPEGGCIQISASNHEIKSGEGLPLSPGRYVKVIVKDQGVGIPDSILSKIFDPYFTTKKKGSGLGLANAYSIIQRHLGHIMAESEPGKGTVFTFFLPALTKKTDAKETDSHQVPLKSGSHKKILVMDDEDIVRDLLVKILSLLEYEVDSAKEGQEAIDKYLKSLSSGKPYHAVILDLTVPGGMGGRETMQELIKINPQIKALVSSGYSMDTILADYKQCGFMAVLSKPYQVEKLSDILSKILD
ncbi:MAG: response regulator, partial [Candidatus Aureabacteria bacterium]|nr:response regulator [Candidatus Auribacterota bacterium]